MVTDRDVAPDHTPGSHPRVDAHREAIGYYVGTLGHERGRRHLVTRPRPELGVTSLLLWLQLAVAQDVPRLVLGSCSTL